MMRPQDYGKQRDFTYFVNRTLAYAAGGGNAKTVMASFDLIEKQIMFWLTNPPEEREIAVNVMKALIDADFGSDGKLDPYKGRLCYLRGLIHTSGFHPIKLNLKQAQVDFNDSGKFGHEPGWEKSGDLYFEAALKKQPPITRDPLFQEAMIAYNKAGRRALVKLIENILLTQYSDAILKGDFTEAIETAKLINSIIKKNPGLPINKEIPKIINKVSTLEALGKLNQEGMLISKAYVSATLERNVEDMLKLFKRAGPTLPNPIYDYYYAVLLRKAAFFYERNKTPDPRLAAEYKEKARKLREEAKIYVDRILENNTYPDFYLPFIQYVKALGIEDGYPEFMNLQLRSPYLLKFAARGGCALAYSYLGNYADTERSGEYAGEHYYELGAHAGDARSQNSYLQRHLLRKFNTEIVKRPPNIRMIIEVTEKTIAMMNRILANPFVVDEDKNMVFNKLEEVKQILAEFTDSPPLLTKGFWVLNPGAAAQFPKLKDIIMSYTDLLRESVAQRLKILKNLLKEINQESGKSDLIPNSIRFLNALREKTVTAIDYLNKLQYEHELARLAARTHKQAFKEAVSFLAKKQRLDDKYYIEYLDPLHRQPELFLRWVQSSTRKNYFAWLREFDSFRTDHVERVRYLDEEERLNFKIHLNAANRLEYEIRRQAVPNGKYLYALDPKNNLYVASEQAENAGVIHFHHSSFLAGKPILSSGMLEIQDGKISAISNYSGHYLPDMYRLYRAINRLRRRGMLAENFHVGVVGVAIPPELALDSNKMTFDQFVSLIKYLIQNRDNAQPEPGRPSPDTPDRADMAVLQAEVNEYLEAQFRQRLEIYESLMPGPAVRAQIYDFLRHDDETKQHLTSVCAGHNAANLLTRIFNRLKFSPDGSSLEEFVLSYMHAVDEGRFTEWANYKTFCFLNMLIGADRKLRPEVLEIFSIQSGKAVPDLITLFYGDPEDPDKILLMADYMKSACLTGMSLLLSGCYGMGWKEDNRSEVYRRLANDKYVFPLAGNVKQDPLANNMPTFNKLSGMSFEQYEQNMAGINAESIVSAELRGLKARTLHEANRLHKMKAEGPRTSGLFEPERGSIRALEERESSLVKVMESILPRAGSVLQSFRLKLDFYMRLAEMLKVTNDVAFDIDHIAHQIRYGLELLMSDSKAFGKSCAKLDDFIMKAVLELTQHTTLAASHIGEQFQAAQHKFYNNNKPAQYHQAVSTFKDELSGILNTVATNVAAPSRR